MDHIAIMRKSWGLLPKILEGTKTVESRWYKNKYAPWGKIQKRDTIYFKNSGEGITIKATVDKVLSFENLTPEIVLEILEEFGSNDGIENSSIPYYFKLFRVKRYCLLIFLKDVQKIEPFQINKKGFGAKSAWLTIADIRQVKVAT
ncbi:MAG: hypothetical protein G01um10145_102 [Microgenomates group bacterium Gr01-1014_5]|nr:MAG: hypothetical protein G01um10145_102 [Microgenomates group bacterium Gr01-1014_5]